MPIKIGTKKETLSKNRIMSRIHMQAPLREDHSKSFLKSEEELPWGGQDGQNGHPTRPQPMATPQAYPQGYVEDEAEVRTPLGIVFTILTTNG
jgi:hypothetical protein